MDSITGLWMFAVGYGIHWVLYKPWRSGQIPRFLFVPLGIVAWLALIGLLLPFKDFIIFAADFFDTPTYGGAFTVGFYAVIFMLIAWGYQNSDVLMLAQLKPFLRASLLFQHTKRVRDDVFAQSEQQDIANLAHTREEREILSEPSKKKRVPMNRDKELSELSQLRRQRTADAGKDELALLAGGSKADITDVCKLFHVANPPHPTFDHLFRVSIDPAANTCRSCIVFDQRTSERVREPKRWFRFCQDLFDHAESMFWQEWMERFKPYYTAFEIECYEEETDSFGIPQKIAFMRVAIPVTILEEYKDRIFIATELEHVSTLTWLQGESS